jgi:hypothetical protein
MRSMGESPKDVTRLFSRKEMLAPELLFHVRRRTLPSSLAALREDASPCSTNEMAKKRARCRKAARGSTVKHTVELWRLRESSH